MPHLTAVSGLPERILLRKSGLGSALERFRSIESGRH